MQTELLCEISQLLLGFSKCSEIELYIKEEKKYYCCKIRNSNINQFSLEVFPLWQTAKSYSKLEETKVQYLSKLCHAVIAGQKDCNIICNPDTGCLWINNTNESKYDAGADIRSFAVFPIRSDQENVGILLLKSNDKDFFSEKEIFEYKGVSDTVGIAFIQQFTQFHLRERVKELTCLYNIAKVTAQPNLSLEEIFQSIVELLPDGWLYPEIAVGRIVYEENEFFSRDNDHIYRKQSADIHANEKKCGVVEVLYTENKADLEEGPFLKEERSLINTISREIGIVIERKLAAEEKEMLREQLRHADRLATIGQLAASVAHELTEPLGSVLGFAQLARKYEGIPEQVDHDLYKIVDASLKARETIRKLLVFSRQTPSTMVLTNLNEIVNECLALLSGRLAKEGISIILNLDEDIPQIVADPAQLNQCLVNLIVNSFQAMQDGGTISLHTCSDNSSVSIIVEDTGIGMDDNIMKQIFVPFFTTKDIDQGTGLGLAIVHGIISSHRGTITVDSKPGSGTRFEIKLPLKGA